MVKNSGGCKTKGLARKLVNAPVSDRVRKIEEEGECYAIVSKMLGNGMCHVNILHDEQILQNIVCHIRGKFRGRNKKANFVAVGSIVLVGLRSWEHNVNACDLANVYNQNQVNSLNINSILFNSIQNFNHDQNNDNISFSNNISSHDPIITSNLEHHNNNDNDNNDINFDDI